MSEFEERDDERDEYIETSMRDCIRESCGDWWVYRNPKTGFIDYRERKVGTEIPNVPCEREQNYYEEYWWESLLREMEAEGQEEEEVWWEERDER
jgi:hypothetical protein